uniref:Uncharacterized protein n=1 Tax=Anguilla anguilla TaxID=7936 RepID=A0A0E9VWU7_ANGAN
MSSQQCQFSRLPSANTLSACDFNFHTEEQRKYTELRFQI